MRPGIYRDRSGKLVQVSYAPNGDLIIKSRDGVTVVPAHRLGGDAA